MVFLPPYGFEEIDTGLRNWCPVFNDLLAKLVNELPTCIPFTAGEDLDQHEWFYIKTTDQKAYKAKSDSASTMPAFGIVRDDVTVGNTGYGQIAGRMTGLSGLIPGMWYYISDITPGGLTSAKPSDFAQIACFAKTATEAYILPVGGIELTGSKVDQTIQLLAASALQIDTNKPTKVETEGTNESTVYLEFPAGSDKHDDWMEFMLPENYDGGTVDIVVCGVAPTMTGDNRLILGYKAYGDDDVQDQAHSTVTLDVQLDSGTADDYIIQKFTGQTLFAAADVGKSIQMHLRNDNAQCDNAFRFKWLSITYKVWGQRIS